MACKKGGTVSVPGVYAGLIDKMPMGAFMNKGLTMKTGQTHMMRYMAPLLERIQKGDIDPSFVISHELPIDNAPEAYRMFRDKQDQCTKVVLKPWTEQLAAWSSLSPTFIKRLLSQGASILSEKQPPWKDDSDALINAGLETLEPKLPKVISPTAHGIIDYTHAAFFFTVEVFSRSNKRAASAAFATSDFILAQSPLTDYRFGAQPVISFETHGKMDSVFAASSWMIPQIFGFRETPAAKIFEANSLAEASVVGMRHLSPRHLRPSFHAGESAIRARGSHV
jgi:hypothetical protein